MPRQIALSLLAAFLLLAAGPGRAERVQAIMTVGAQVTPAACINPMAGTPGPDLSCAGTTVASAQGLVIPPFAVAGEDGQARLTIAY